MDKRLLQFYESELSFLREMGGEFAQAYPKIAGRLGLEANECIDPYVERLLEGFSFLSARIQLKLAAEFPQLIHHILDLIYPNYLAPMPSMTIVRFEPDLYEGNLARGYKVNRGTVLRSLLGKGGQTSCEFRTAHDIHLWPIELSMVNYFIYPGSLNGESISRFGPIKAGLRLQLKATAGLKFNEISLDQLSFYIHGNGSMPIRILEQILCNTVGVVIVPAGQHRSDWTLLDKSTIRQIGFEEDEALLPQTAQNFQGYRYLQEYFAFPQRYLFAEISGLQKGLSRCTGDTLDLVFLLNNYENSLETVVSADNIVLFCTPAINLFEKRADRVHLSDYSNEHLVTPDRTRPLDYEIHSITSVSGYGSGAHVEREFSPFYTANDLHFERKDQAYYVTHRVQRNLTELERKQGARSSYLGSEVYLSLTDPHQAPYAHNLRQLGVEMLCTNRDLVLSMPVGQNETDFTAESNAPILSVCCQISPSSPSPSYTEGETAWRLINHLSLNYLSLLDNKAGEGAKSLKEMLRLYCLDQDAHGQQQINSLRSVTARQIVRKIPGGGRVTYGQGLLIEVLIDESAFGSESTLLLGSVLERFFAKYVAINSFTETHILSAQRSKPIVWPARIGKCQIL